MERMVEEEGRLEEETRRRKAELTALFVAADDDSDKVAGKLTLDEWRDKFAGIMSEGELRQLFDACDKDKSGTLDLEEFARGLANNKKIKLRKKEDKGGGGGGEDGDGRLGERDEGEAATEIVAVEKSEGEVVRERVRAERERAMPERERIKVSGLSLHIYIACILPRVYIYIACILPRTTEISTETSISGSNAYTEHMIYTKYAKNRGVGGRR